MDFDVVLIVKTMDISKNVSSKKIPPGELCSLSWTFEEFKN